MLRLVRDFATSTLQSYVRIRNGNLKLRGVSYDLKIAYTLVLPPRFAEADLVSNSHLVMPFLMQSNINSSNSVSLNHEITPILIRSANWWTVGFLDHNSCYLVAHRNLSVAGFLLAKISTDCPALLLQADKFVRATSGRPSESRRTPN